MKKVLIVLLLVAMVAPVFADDAATLPAGVMRTRIIPSLSIVNEWFDSSGSRQSSDGIGPEGAFGNVSSAQLYNLSGAIEYGVTDWLTAGIQWTPGWTFNTDIDFDTPLQNNKLVSTGVNDLFVGFKAQVLGPNGLVPNQQVRIAITPGVKIPLSQYDASGELQSFSGGNDFSFSSADRGAWGLGGRFALDYFITPDLFINLYNQTSFFLPVTRDVGFIPPLGAAVENVKIEHGIESIFEIEANYSMPLGNGVNLGLGLPVTYGMTGERKVEYVTPALLGGTRAFDSDSSWILSIGPSVSFFFTSWALPMEFELGYTLPIMGENSPAANTISLQIKNFLRF